MLALRDRLGRRDSPEWRPLGDWGSMLVMVSGCISRDAEPEFFFLDLWQGDEGSRLTHTAA